MNSEYFIKNSNQGFTIVESLIAIIILGIIMAGGISFYHFANDLYFSGLNSRIAASIASSKMEVCKNTGYTNLTNTGETVCRDIGTAVSVGQLTGTRTVTVSAVSVSGVPFELIASTVNWTDPSKGAQLVSIQTYVGQ